ncbi:unnamed protein product [Ectocarpus fasciculatus]
MPRAFHEESAHRRNSTALGEKTSLQALTPSPPAHNLTHPSPLQTPRPTRPKLCHNPHARSNSQKTTSRETIIAGVERKEARPRGAEPRQKKTENTFTNGVPPSEAGTTTRHCSRERTHQTRVS